MFQEVIQKIKVARYLLRHGVVLVVVLIESIALLTVGRTWLVGCKWC